METLITQDFKACMNCIHFRDYGDLFLFCDKYTYKVGDVITGKVETKKRLCVFVRDDENLCGLNADGYEPKDIIDQPHRFDEPETVWGHLKAIFTTRWPF